MRFFSIGIFLLFFLQVPAQDACEHAAYGVEIPFYKKYYKSNFSSRSADSTRIPQELWKKINYQVNNLTNGILSGRLRVKRVYFTAEKAELFERENPVIDDSARIVYVKYRIIYELAMNNSIKLIFGLDIGTDDNIMYKNELPLLFENKIPAIMPCSTALKKASSLKKEIKSFSQGALYYNALNFKFEWNFSETTTPDADHRYTITFDAITGKSVKIDKLKIVTPKVIQADE